jgi:hypothetical protein
MKTLRPVTRRNALKLGAAAAALPLVHIRTAGAAGKVSIGFWDHWVPAGNDVMKQQVQAWSDKSKVEVQADFITSNGFKNILTIAAEAQAKTGHDVFAFPTWEVQNHADQMEPMDDVMGRLTVDRFRHDVAGSGIQLRDVEMLPHGRGECFGRIQAKPLRFGAPARQRGGLRPCLGLQHVYERLGQQRPDGR